MSRVGRRARRSSPTVVLLASLLASSGCTAAVTSSRPPPQNDAAEPRATAAAGRPAQRTRNGRSTTVGLPLTRPQKIGLWAGVAVVLASMMADENEEDDVSDDGR